MNHQLEHGDAEKPVDFYCQIGRLRKQMIEKIREENNWK